jgi:hypothetical protein
LIDGVTGGHRVLFALSGFLLCRPALAGVLYHYGVSSISPRKRAGAFEHSWQWIVIWSSTVAVVARPLLAAGRRE